MTDALLALNAGSSSIKFAVYPADVDASPIVSGAIEQIGGTPKLEIEWASGEKISEALEVSNNHERADLLDKLLCRIDTAMRGMRLIAVGHRVVHGGANFAAPTTVDSEVLRQLEALSPLAPSHQPHNLDGIRAVDARWPNVLQVACFDTAFHRTQPRIAQLFALPRQLSEEGVLRYGFHGLSYEYIAGVLPEQAGSVADDRVIVAHLGHGASMCGMIDRRSVATSMGFTALDGLVMGKRCGDLDPGVVLYLLREKGMTVAEVDDLLAHQSGLLGVSGISDDMRELLASEHPHAAEAVDLFVYRAVRRIGSLTTVLGGLDALVFTGGIGEHSPEIRQRIIDGMSWLGVRCDESANSRNSSKISLPSSKIDLLVIPTDEERIIARSTWNVISSSHSERWPSSERKSIQSFRESLDGTSPV